ncbi:MAG: hypothetical protein M3Y50_16990 [Acidobacteriota bacterium]|nr:hypothetical protein [Acidobacteriota bacterium]
MFFPQKFFPQKRWKHFAAMVLIGDGVMALVRPQHDALAWKRGPAVWQKLMTELHDRPALTRLIGLGQIAGGICWALQQEKHEDDPLLG